jgi:hypothetical protein
MTYRSSHRSLKVEEAGMKTMQGFAYLLHETLLDAANHASRAKGGLLKSVEEALGATIFLKMGA